jgi:hypothetical protein
MRKVLLPIVFLISFLQTQADEGMWLPLLLGKQVYSDMVKKGLKLKADQLYSANHASIKDAIIIFGNGCTGEIVSNQGLIFTNHHCGYDAITKASTVEHNYLRDGFMASDLSKEIPSTLTVRFLNRIEDVTDKVMSALGSLNGTERSTKFNQVSSDIVKQATGGDEFKSAVVASMFAGNQYFLYVYDVYKDIRLVAAPPESIGKFGGDTDNWEWPRHTGDFSVFRVYAGKDGKPAKFSMDNVALKPKYFLPVSIKGINDGDYAMIFGYPGGTNRYETSMGVNLSTDINNPTLVKLRDMRLKYMYEEMKKDPSIKLQLASDYASIANYWKFYEGETKELKKYDVYGQKQKQEQAFLTWAKGKPEYENIFNEYTTNYATWKPYAMSRVYYTEGIQGSPLIKFATSLLGLNRLMNSKESSKSKIDSALQIADKARVAFIASENRASDEKILADVLMMYRTDIDPSQQPQGFYDDLTSNYGTGADAYKKYAADIFNNTIILDDKKWRKFVDDKDEDHIRKDPAIKLAQTFAANYQQNIVPKYNAFVTKNADLARAYMKGVMSMDPKKAAMMYPDANFTMRVSYGNVKSYKPRDAVNYDYVTTMKGVMEKYVPGDYEFDLPQRFLDLYKAKDFGQYIDKKKNDIVVGFITTNDITGGNSGSPVINGNGELIGLAFDGNYEALSHKIAFDKDLNRTINVDVRYVLWVIDKYLGAKNLIAYLKLAK